MRIVKEGRIEKTRGLQTGPPLIRSKLQWRSHYRSYLTRELMKTLPLLLGILVVSYVLLWFFIRDVGLVLLILLLVAITVLASDFRLRALLSPGEPPGLFELGLMHPKGFFIPYGELRGAKVTTFSFILFPKKLTFIPFYESDFVDYTEWDMPADILEDEGIEELHHRIDLALEEMMEEEG
jgi:hypothetical protein